jgi:hypothetical protein
LLDASGRQQEIEAIFAFCRGADLRAGHDHPDHVLTAPDISELLALVDRHAAALDGWTAMLICDDRPDWSDWDRRRPTEDREAAGGDDQGQCCAWSDRPEAIEGWSDRHRGHRTHRSLSLALSRRCNIAARMTMLLQLRRWLPIHWVAHV